MNVRMENRKSRDLQRRGKPRAIILGVEHPRSVAVMRSLGRAGIPVVAVDHDPAARGLYSRYISEKFLISADSDPALEFLESLGHEGGGILIPTTDHYLIFVAKNADRLSQFFILTTPPWEVLERMMNKPQCYGLAQEAGLKSPRFFTPHTVEEMKQIVADLDFKNHAYILSVKLPEGPGPKSGADARTGRFTKAAGPDATSMQESCLEIFSRTGELPMIVEIVPGESDRCVGVSMVVDHNHEPLVLYCVRRLQLFPYSRSGVFIHPYVLGANVYCESIHDHEAIEAAKRFVHHTKYYGVITVEFRRDSTDGSLKLIKTDPRVVRATSLSTALGLDIPTTLYHMFTDGQVNASRSYPDGVAWIWLTWYLSTLWENRSLTPVRKELLTLLRNIRKIKAFAYLSVHDPLPFLVDVRRWGPQWARRGSKWLKRKVFPSHSVLRKLSWSFKRR